MIRRSFRPLLLLVVLVLLLSATVFLPPSIPSHASGASITLSSSYGPPTSAVQVKGNGFKGSETVLLLFDSTQIKSVTASSTGSFSAKVTIPGSALPGNHIIQAKGKSSGSVAQATFLVQTDWVQQGFNREHTGFNVFENVHNTSNVSGLIQSWLFNKGFYVGTIAVAHGVIYFYCNFSYVCALSTATGQLLWSYNTNAQLFGTPAIANSLVYMITTQGHVDALNANTGNLVWSYATGLTISNSPLTANGLVYVGGNDVLYALNGTTGQAVWKHSFPSFFQTPSIDGGLLYISAGDSLYALNSQTGQIAWHVSAKGGTPVIANGMIYMNDFFDGKLLALNEQTGALKWSDVYQSVGDPSVAHGIVYVTVRSVCTLEALSATTGALLWQYNSINQNTCVEGTPIVANGVVYVGGSENNNINPNCNCNAVYALSATTGVLAEYIEDDFGSVPGGYNPIVVVNGTLYYAAMIRVYAYRLPSTA